MNLVVPFRELLKKNCDPSTMQYISLVGEATAQLQDQLINLQDILKIETGKITPKLARFNLNDIVHRAAILWKGAAKIAQVDIEVQLPANAVYVVSDSALLQRIIETLIRNGIKYKSNEKFPSYVFVNVESKGDFCKIFISDNGMKIEGDHEINPENVELKAKPKIARRSSDLGFGRDLSIVSKLIDRLDGHEIAFNTEANVGAEFIISIVGGSKLDRSDSQNVSNVQVNAANLRNKYIIIVDDGALKLNAFGRRLQSEGALVTIYSDSTRVDDLIGSIERVPSLIIARSKLLNETSGTAVIQAARSEWGWVPAIIITDDRDILRDELIDECTEEIHESALDEVLLLLVCQKLGR
ncbi:sensor histidine kinase [Ideonella paludis]